MDEVAKQKLNQYLKDSENGVGKQTYINTKKHRRCVVFKFCTQSRIITPMEWW